MKMTHAVTAAAMLGIAISGGAWAQMGQGQGQDNWQQQSGQYQDSLRQGQSSQDSGWQTGQEGRSRQDQYRQDRYPQDSGYQQRGQYQQDSGLQRSGQYQQDQRYQGDMQRGQRFGQDRFQQQDFQAQSQGRWPSSEARVQRASQLIGADVRNWNNEDLGEINDLVINRSQGQVIYAALSRGGVLGIGDTMHAVPFESLRLSADGQYFILDVPQRSLTNARGFDQDNWPATANDSLVGTASRQQQFQGQQDGRFDQQQRYDQQQRFDQQRQRQFDSRRGQSGVRNGDAYHGLGDGGPDQWPYVFEDQDPDTTRTQRVYRSQPSDFEQRDWQARQQTQRQQQQFQQGQQAPRFQTGQAQRVDWPADEDQHWSNRVSRLLGTDLIGQDGNEVGEIEDLAIDMREGRIAYVIISADDVIGDDRLVAMPWQQVSLDQEQNQYALQVDRQTLARAPSFAEDSWPNLADPRYSTEVYRVYGIEPYWMTYGYTVYELDQQDLQARQQQQQQQQQGFQGQALQGQNQLEQLYLQSFQQGQQRRLSGQIHRIVSLTPQQGMPRVLAIEVGDQQQVVHLGPINQIRDMIQIRRGNEVQVTGRQTQLNGQDVIIAQQIQVDGRTIQLRDRNGQPTWTQTQQRLQRNPQYNSSMQNQQPQRFRQNQNQGWQNQ